MEKKAYARTVKKTVEPRDPFMEAMNTNDQVQEKRRGDRIRSTKDFSTVAENVAKSSVYVRNWYIKEAKKEFPVNDRMKRIDKYFPYAQGGEIFVDEPKDEDEAEFLYKKKAPQMKKWGYRYVVVETDTDLYMALKQLGAV